MFQRSSGLPEAVRPTQSMAICTIPDGVSAYVPQGPTPLLLYPKPPIYDQLGIWLLVIHTLLASVTMGGIETPKPR